jgi:Spy/CpxP family protein refolding chaperone
MLTRSISRFVLPLGLALAAPAFGCGGGTANAQVSSAQPAARAPVAQNAHGPLKVIGEALGDVPLTADQRTHIEQLAADADARHGDARAARKDLAMTLAAQIEVGRIDRAALAPKIDALSAALQKAQPADRASFEQLHAILGSDQRVAFVDALEAHIGGHMGAMRGTHPLKQWADDLKLSEDQKTQIRTALKGRFGGPFGGGPGHDGGRGPHADGDGHERGAKVLAAFKQDRFVIDEVLPPKDISKQVAHMSDRFLGIAEAVLPLLTPDQRKLAGAKLRERAETLGAMGPVGPAIE